MQKYECKECQAEFEKAESCGCCGDEVKCPKCGSANVSKVEAKTNRLVEFFQRRRYG